MTYSNPKPAPRDLPCACSTRDPVSNAFYAIMSLSSTGQQELAAIFADFKNNCASPIGLDVAYTPQKNPLPDLG